MVLKYHCSREPGNNRVLMHALYTVRHKKALLHIVVQSRSSNMSSVFFLPPKGNVKHITQKPHYVHQLVVAGSICCLLLSR